MLFEHYCLLTKKHTGWCYSLRITDNLHKKLTAKGMNLYKHQNLYCQSYTNSAYYMASRTINSLKTQVSGLSNKAQ